MSPLLPWSAQPTYTMELLFGSTAMESVEPTRSCPRVGAFDQGMETRLTTIRPGNLSEGSFNAWKGLGPAPPVSSRTTTTSLVATVPLNFRHPKKGSVNRIVARDCRPKERPTFPGGLPPFNRSEL